jgi:murein DD-endopeptidase MepM/ murein hydrolase activator NlpD
VRLSLILTLALAPAGANAFDLGLPVACTLGEDCYIQQYFDHDAGPQAQDFTCGSLSYDGHNGTDFAVPTRQAMAAGVSVLAAAPGVVRGMRDGVADFEPPAEGRECGNGVVIDHAEGWQTQYCHLRQGSVLVQPGQSVALGQPLGLIGQSGMAEFPHMHLSVRHNGVEVDPFALGAPSCGKRAEEIWTQDIPYTAGGILQVGFADLVPEFDGVKAGMSPAPLPPQAPGLVAWAYLFGTRAGDEVLIEINGPRGELLSETVAMERTQALSFRAVGRKLRGEGWPVGDYRAEVWLIRDGAEIDRAEAVLTITP